MLLAFLQGVGLLIYIVLWLVMPEQVEGQDATRSGFDSMSVDFRRVSGELRVSSAGTEAGSARPLPILRVHPVTGDHDLHQSILLGLVLVLVGVNLLGANTGLCSGR